MIRYLSAVLFILSIDVFVYCVWFFLGWLLSFSIILTWILGIAALFICPIIIYLTGIFLESKYQCISALIYTTMMIMFMLASVVFVSIFAEKKICTSSFSRARTDAETCDYLCFDSITLEKEKIFEYTYTYKNTAKEYSKKDFSFVPVQLPKEQFIWLEQTEKESSGNCMYVYSKRDEYNTMRDRITKPVLGRQVQDPAQDIQSLRMSSIYFSAILNIVTLLLGFRYAPNEES